MDTSCQGSLWPCPGRSGAITRRGPPASLRTTSIQATEEPAAPCTRTTGARDPSPSSRTRTFLSPMRSLRMRWSSFPELPFVIQPTKRSIPTRVVVDYQEGRGALPPPSGCTTTPVGVHYHPCRGALPPSSGCTTTPLGVHYHPPRGALPPPSGSIPRRR